MSLPKWGTAEYRHLIQIVFPNIASLNSANKVFTEVEKLQCIYLIIWPYSQYYKQFILLKTKFYIGLGFLFILLNLGLGSWGLTESSEARYAEMGREMAISGDYLHPQLMGIDHYHKPPVTYYLTALGYKIFGIGEYGARFFLSVALIVQLLLVFKIGLLLFKEQRTAVFSAIIYFSFPVVLIAARNLTTDCYLTTFILAALYFWLVRKQGGQLYNLYLFYIFLGIAFLTKGPVIWLAPLVFIACYKFALRERLNVTIHTVLGTLLMLAISASWFIAVVVDHPRLWDYFIQKQIVERSVAAEKFHRSKPFWYYLVFMPLLGLPFFGLILAGFVNKFKTVLAKREMPWVLSLTIGLLLLIFSLFSSKLILYILPIYPFIALLGGYLITVMPERFVRVYVKIYFGFCIFLALILIGLNVYGEFKINAPLSIILAMALLLFVFGLWSQNKLLLNHKLLTATMGFSLAILFTYTFFSAKNPYTINSVKALMARVKEVKGDSLHDVYIYDQRIPSAQFYLGRPIVSMANTNYRAIRETEFERDSTYLNSYYNLQDKSVWEMLKTRIGQKNNVLILKSNAVLPDSLSFLRSGFRNDIIVDKWRIYY